MNYCKQCGAELPEGAKFCTQCGQTVDAQEEKQTEVNKAAADQPQPEESEPAAATESEMETPPAHIPAEEQEKATVDDYQDSQAPVQQAGQGYVVPPPQVPVQQPGQDYVAPPQPQAPGQQPGYGYTTPPPQQHPQGYGYGAPQAQQTYAYAPTPPPTKEKRKRGGLIAIISIIVVVALLVAGYFVFGKDLLMSTEKKWQKAELASTIIAKDSPLYTMREAGEEFLEQTKYGYETDLTFDVKTDVMDEETAAIMAVLSGLRINMKSQVDLDQANPHINTSIGIGRRGETGNILSAQFRDVDNYYLISVPEILTKPLAISKDYLEEMMEYESGVSLPLDESLAGMSGMRDDLKVFSSETMDIISRDLKEIFFKHVGETELVKGETLVVGNVSQKLNYYKVKVAADDFAPMAKEVLLYMIDSPDIERFVKAIDKSMELAEGSSAYQEFTDGLNEMLSEINANPEDFKVELERILYVDAKNNPVGGKFFLSNTIDGELQEVMFASLLTEDNGQYASLLELEAEGESGFKYLSHYSLEDSLYTGSYEIQSLDTEVVRGTFANFTIKSQGKDIYPIGTITAQVRNIDDLDQYSDDLYMEDIVPQTISLKYQGRLENKDGLDHLVGSLEISVQDLDMPVTLDVGFDHRAIPEASLSFDNAMVDDFIDLSDDYAMMELMEDEVMMDKLFEALGQLGINLDDFMME